MLSTITILLFLGPSLDFGMSAKDLESQLPAEYRQSWQSDLNNQLNVCFDYGQAEKQLSFDAKFIPNAIDYNWEYRNFSKTQSATKSHGSFSGIPLGTDAHFHSHKSRAFLQCARISGAMLIVSLSILPKKQNGVITFPPVDPKSEMRLLERLSRVFLANFAGTQLQNSNPITFIGQSMPTLSRSGKPRIAKLATLAAHANFSPEYDAELGLYRFQWRGKSVVVPLASDQVKVNGVWKKLGEFVLQKNKETYIDPVGLDAAVGN